MLVEHAKKELELAGLFDTDSDYDGMIGDAVLELIDVFSKQGHSGYSAGMVSSLFNKLSRYETLTPLTFEDTEWVEVGDGIFQNNRRSAVFKNSSNNRPYYIDAYVIKTPNGDCYHGSASLKDGRNIHHCYIRDPSMMPTITIDVVEKEVGTYNLNKWIEDETQLDELAKYYDFTIE